MVKYVSPSIDLTAFNCPHCGALAQQFWRTVHSKRLNGDADTPFLMTHERVDEIEKEGESNPPPDVLELFRKIADGEPCLWSNSTTEGGITGLNNVYLSVCYQCSQLTIWLRDRILWPLTADAPDVNEDLPAQIRADYDEAASILNLSPRGSAALLRLAIQKLCEHLDAGGNDLNSAIANLVKRGLDSRVQQALDIVRVIGNNAVHPGAIDMKDNLAVATRLFELVNLIVEKMISEPKHVAEMFEALPDNAKKGISDRDIKKE